MMDHHQIRYRQNDNCFTWIEDVERAQQLMDRQLRISGPKALARFARQLNPAHGRMFRRFPAPYYWSMYQSEWATDVMFRTPADLAAIYPALVLHGMQTFSSGDVMRFLGRKPHGRFEGEIVSDFKNRPEGIRIKHCVDDNSVKAYDKAGNSLRVETTMNNPADFKVFRTQKVPRTHRYLLTARGRDVISAVLAAHRIRLDQLNKLAA